MILFLQILLGAAVVAWHLFGGLPPLAAIPLACFLVAFVGLWRDPRKPLARPDGINISQAPPFRNPPPALQPHPLPPSRCPGPPRCEPCRDTLAELELAERFERESG